MNKKKIALVGFRLSGGGSDRVMATLSQFFHSQGFNVHVIIFNNELGYQYSGTLFNLGKYKSESNTIFNKVQRFKRFKSYIKQNNFDNIIDFRFRINTLQEYLVSKYIYTSGAYYTVHSSHLQTYFPKRKFLARKIYTSKHTLVSVSKGIKSLIEEHYGFKKINYLYNPINQENITLKSNEPDNLDFDYIIAMGRFDTDVKQFHLLIEAYSKSILPNKKTHLVILGTGGLLDKLKQVANHFKMASLVHFLGFQENPFKYLASAKFYVLTSKYEGFPMVLLESLACGTPTISFDCPTGPSEIIKHKENGLLVKNQDVKALINAIDELYSNTVLYKYCKSNSLQSVESFSVNIIGKQWLKLLQLHD